jgi:hypothetical protein
MAQINLFAWAERPLAQTLAEGPFSGIDYWEKLH